MWVLDPTVMKKGGSKLIRPFSISLVSLCGERRSTLWVSLAAELFGVRQSEAYGEIEGRRRQIYNSRTPSCC
jgi:hypothetical protein